MTDSEPVETMQKVFGGTIFLRPAKDKRKKVYCWSVRSFKLQPLLEQVQDSLLIERKRKNAQLCLALIDLMTRDKMKRRLTDNELAERDSLYQQALT